MDAAIAALWDEARPRALARVDAVEDAVAALMGGALDDETRDGARREAHKLAGSLGTFGVPEGSTIARELERRFEGAPQQADAPALAEQVIALRRAIEAGASAQPAAGEGPRVVLAGLGSARTDALLRAAAGRGWRLATAREEPPPGDADVVLLGPEVTDCGGAVERLTAGGAAVAVVAGGDADRVELVRRGARRLLPDTLEPAAVLDELGDLDAGRRSTTRSCWRCWSPRCARPGWTSSPARTRWRSGRRSSPPGPTSSCSTSRCPAPTGPSCAARCAPTRAGAACPCCS